MSDATSAVVLEVPVFSTLLGLVQVLHRLGVPGQQLEAVARELVSSGHVTLTGSFAGQRLQ